MGRRVTYISLLLLSVFGGEFITSERFMNVQNDSKSYWAGIVVLLLFLICSASKNGWTELKASLQSQELVVGITILSFILSSYGLMQYIGFIPSGHHAFPITGTYENPAGFVSAQVLMYPYALSLSCAKVSRHRNIPFIRIFAVLTSVACSITIVLSGSRTGFISICFVTAVIVALKTDVLRIFNKRRWLWIPLAIVAIASMLLLYHIKEDSANGRLLVWRVCFDLIRERPLLGYGPGGFHKVYMDAQATYFSLHPDSPFVMLADNVTHPFNEYILLAVNYGLAGLAISAALCVLIAMRAFRCNDETAKVISLSVTTSLFVMCQFSYPFHYAVTWLMASFAILPVLRSKNTVQNKRTIPGYLRVVTTLSFTVLLALVLRMIYSDLRWAEMSRRSLAGETERMLPHYEKMKSQMQHNPLFLYNYAAELNYAGRYDESLQITRECKSRWCDYDVQMLLADNLENLGESGLSIEAYWHAADMIPCRFEPLNSIMGIYLSYGDTVNAERIARQILFKPVKVNSVRVQQIRADAENLILSITPIGNENSHVNEIQMNE